MRRLIDWLERRWVAPAYAGWLLAGIGFCFFAAATNTMAGWLYAISGMIFALLLLAAILPKRSLLELQVSRKAIAPVTMGDVLSIEITIHNPTKAPKTLLEVKDLLPHVISKPVSLPVEAIAARSDFHWTYELPTNRRGAYHWQEVQIRTAAPLGLFWCRRSHNAPATAIVYPTILPLKSCPLIDKLGQADNTLIPSLSPYAQLATEGVSRGLRPYRYGDPTRLIHWRTSARYGEFKVRELEVFHGSQEVTICLDSGGKWSENEFEQAAIAAASLYFYANRCQLQVKLWTAATGLVWGDRTVLETLARVNFNEEATAEVPKNTPVIWLTNSSDAIANLPAGSAWVLWGLSAISNCPGITIEPEVSLSAQLQI
jgi:uncharacterized protein (DUF58 family)